LQLNGDFSVQREKNRTKLIALVVSYKINLVTMKLPLYAFLKMTMKLLYMGVLAGPKTLHRTAMLEIMRTVPSKMKGGSFKSYESAEVGSLICVIFQSVE
jgi:hypothetical protein